MAWGLLVPLIAAGLSGAGLTAFGGMNLASTLIIQEEIYQKRKWQIEDEAKARTLELERRGYSEGEETLDYQRDLSKLWLVDTGQKQDRTYQQAMQQQRLEFEAEQFEANAQIVLADRERYIKGQAFLAITNDQMLGTNDTFETLAYIITELENIAGMNNPAPEAQSEYDENNPEREWNPYQNAIGDIRI